MKQISRKISLVLLSLIMVLSLLLPAAPFTSAADEVVVTILHTNDVHGNQIASNSAIGLQAVYNVRQAIPNSLLFDVGDAFQGSLLSSMDNGRTILKMIEAAEFDAMTIGNHEFDYGQAELLAGMNSVNFPFFGANIVGVDKGSGVPQISQDFLDALTEYEVYEVAGIKIGVFGVSTTTASVTVSPVLMEGVDIVNPAPYASAIVNKLITVENVDFIVCLAHEGVSEDGADRVLDELLPGQNIDLILAGHDHAYQLGDQSILLTHANGKTLMAETGSSGAYLGAVEITFDGTGAPTLVESKAINKAAAADTNVFPVVANPTLAALEEDYSIYRNALNSIEFGTFAQGMYRSGKEASSGTFYADAQKWYAENYAFKDTEYDNDDYVITAMINSGALRSDPIPRNTMTTFSTWSAVTPYAFGGYPEYVHMSAAMLYKIFEVSVAGFNQQIDGTESVASRFWHPAGFTVEIDVSKTAAKYDETGSASTNPNYGALITPGEKVTSIYLDVDGGNVRLDESDPRRIIMNIGSYNLTGGDGYFLLRDSLAANDGLGDGEVVIIENVTVTDENIMITEMFMKMMLKQPGHAKGIVWPQQFGRFIVTGGPYTETSYDFTGYLVNGMIGVAGSDTASYDIGEGGSFVAGAPYTAYIDGVVFDEVVTDENGMFVLKDLPNGPHELILVGNTEELTVYLNNQTGTTSRYIKAEIPTPVVYATLAHFGVFTGSGSITSTIDAPLSRFVELRLNDTVVNPKHYAVREGSTIITLNKNYLNSLGNGNHTFTFVFIGGSASSTLTVNVGATGGNTGGNNTGGSAGSPVTTATTPQTGDTGNIAVWFVAMSVSALGALYLYGVRKRDRYEQKTR